MKRSLLPFSFITASLTFQLIGAEPLKQAPNDLAKLNLITGFHSHIYKQSGLEFKIFEIDGSSSVALNPTYLYLGITNNQLGDDAKSIMLELPNVSRILSVKFPQDAPTIEINAVFDSLNDDSLNSTISGVIKIDIALKQDLLSNAVKAKIIYKEK